jgi:hypothetical protein
LVGIRLDLLLCLDIIKWSLWGYNAITITLQSNLYSDHLPTATTIWTLNLSFYNIDLRLNNDHLSTTAKYFWVLGEFVVRTGLTVYKKLNCLLEVSYENGWSLVFKRWLCFSRVKKLSLGKERDYFYSLFAKILPLVAKKQVLLGFELHSILHFTLELVSQVMTFLQNLDVKKNGNIDSFFPLSSLECGRIEMKKTKQIVFNFCTCNLQWSALGHIKSDNINRMIDSPIT